MIESRNDVIRSLVKKYDCDLSVFKMLQLKNEEQGIQLKNEEQNKLIIPEVPSMIFTCLKIENR